jgi:hypothetical protein
MILRRKEVFDGAFLTPFSFPDPRQLHGWKNVLDRAMRQGLVVKAWKA